MAAHEFRLTKYDRALRVEGIGAFEGDDWTSISDIGETFSGQRLTLADYLDVEAKHLVAVASFIEESDVLELVARDVGDPFGRFRVTEGARLSPVEAIEVVRQLLREEGWCRLEAGESFFIHAGYDYYLYVGSDRACPQSVERAERLGLFVDPDFPSPYHRENFDAD